VAIESTGVYWQPVYNILAPRLTVWLVNARHVKQVPGRKTDQNDAMWLAQLLQHGLLKPSYIPPTEQRELRDLTRYRESLLDDRARVLNRIQKLLEGANIKLAAVVSDVKGLTAQQILRALVGGETDPALLAQLACGKLQKKQAELERALEGQFQAHHRFMLTHLLSQMDFLDDELAALAARIDAVLEHLPAFAAVVERLDTIPGINRTAALVIVAEIGVDMQRFPTDRHLAAWAGVAPGNNETGGKQRAAASRKGNRHLRRALVQAAWAAARKKDSYLRALYYRLASRRGAHRAAVAVGRTILQIAYHLISKETTYQDLGHDYFDRVDRERTRSRLVGRLQALGFAVSVTDGAQPAAV
jgi:transposase